MWGSEPRSSNCEEWFCSCEYEVVADWILSSGANVARIWIAKPCPGKCYVEQGQMQAFISLPSNCWWGRLLMMEQLLMVAYLSNVQNVVQSTDIRTSRHLDVYLGLSLDEEREVVAAPF
jgi:hypothetical protein